MKIEEHEKAYEEHIKHIEKSIEEEIEDNQRNIGFNISQGAVELLSIYLHKLRVFQSSGDQLDHRIFKSPSLIKTKLPQDFPSKNVILAIIKSIEEERISLCYGNRKPKERIESALIKFQKLRKVINQNLKNGQK